MKNVRVVQQKLERKNCCCQIAFLRKTPKILGVCQFRLAGILNQYNIPDTQIPIIKTVKKSRMKTAFIFGIILVLCLGDASAKESKGGKSFYKTNSRKNLLLKSAKLAFSDNFLARQHNRKNSIQHYWISSSCSRSQSKCFLGCKSAAQPYKHP